MTKNSSLLGLGFVILVVVGVSYWSIRENSQSTAPTKNVSEAPAPAMQGPGDHSPPTGGQSPGARSSASGQAPAPPVPTPGQGPLNKSNAASSTEPPSSEAPRTNEPPRSATGQSAEPPSPTVASPPTGTSQSTQGTAPAQSSSTALAVAMPADDKMSPENRHQVQQALQRRGYYQGASDGIFGPATRSAIQRFQESMGPSALVA
jgi:hypothetical protein